MFAKSFNVLCFDFGPLQVKIYLNVQSKHNPAIIQYTYMHMYFHLNWQLYGFSHIIEILLEGWT